MSRFSSQLEGHVLFYILPFVNKSHENIKTNNVLVSQYLSHWFLLKVENLKKSHKHIVSFKIHINFLKQPSTIGFCKHYSGVNSAIVGDYFQLRTNPHLVPQ